MRAILAAAIGTVSLSLLWQDAAAETQLTEGQYKSIMTSPFIARGNYTKLDKPHKALAACIDWSKARGDKIADGPTVTLGGDDLAEIKAEVMRNCVGFEKEYNCKCQIVDVDGKLAQ